MKRGLIAGLLAAAAFLVWFTIVDVAQGQPLRTPAYMSGLIFSFTTALPASARLLGYTMLHFISFGIVGVILARHLEATSIKPIVFGVALGVLLFGLFYAAGLAVGVNVVRGLGWWELLSANVIAGVVMFGYLRRFSDAEGSSPRVFHTEQQSS